MRWATVARTIVFTLSLSFHVTTRATAGEGGGSSLQAGAKIRVSTATSSSPLKGSLVAVDDAVLTLAVEGRAAGHQSLARSDITRLDVVRGKKSHWLAGAVAGAAGGLGLTALYCGRGTCDESGEWAGSAAFLGGIGAVGGAVVGALIRTDRWERVSGEELTVGIGPAPGRGVAMTVRLSFQPHGGSPRVIVPAR